MNGVQQNVGNPKALEIQQPFAKLVIKDDPATQNPITNQYGFQQLAKQPAQYQYPSFNQYQPQYNQQQQPFNAQYYQNQADPKTELLYLDSRGFNLGKNRQFGLFVTFMWALELLALELFIIYVDQDIFYQISMICFIINIGILISSVFIKQISVEIQAILLIAYLITSLFSTIMYDFVFYEIGKLIFYIKILFEYCLLIVMTASFIYLLILKKKPQLLVISIISALAIAVAVTILFEGVTKIEYYAIPILIGTLQSFMLGRGLQRVYSGKNNIIKKDNYLIGFLQFKVCFFLLCL